MGAQRAHDGPHDEGVSRAGADALRIILVGRTGLDAKLRLDPAIELVRVKTALEAIGELSDPIDESSPRRSVVIVAADADPAKRSGKKSAEVGEFVSALRHVDPGVRVLRMDSGESPAPAGAYDGVLSAAATAESLRAAVRAGPPAPAPSPPPQPRPAPEAAPEPDAPDVEVSTLVDELLADKKPAPMSEVGDEGLLRLLLQGRDITDAAIEIIRRRLGGKDIAFVTQGRTGRERTVEPEDGGHEAAVSWRGRLLGRLRSREIPPEHLAPQASWLASWLAMRDQHVQLRDAAFTDSLTGAHNRRFFDHFLVSAIEQARKERRTLTVLVFDLDNFKQFNDRYGHAAGDDILVQVVRLLRSVIRPTDKVCRMGGDEFVVIFYEPAGPRTPSSKPPSNVHEIAQRFQREIAHHRFPKLGREAPGPLTLSGGLATYPWDGGNATELLARADDLAMQSKRQGKNAIMLGPGAERECGSK